MIEQITEWMTTLSAWAISISAIVAALAAVFKPVRKALPWLREKCFGKSKISEQVEHLGRQVGEPGEQFKTVSDKNDANERDRLKDVLFQYGNNCRNGQKITGEQYRNVQRVFQKYTSLGGNDIAHDEYNFITNYYNKKGWLHHDDEQ